MAGFAFDDDLFGESYAEAWFDTSIAKPAAAPAAGILSVLGSRAKNYFGSYAIAGGTTGTWTDSVGGISATRSVAGTYPAVGTSPASKTYPNFDGSNDHLRSTGLTNLPVYNSAHHYAFGFACYLPSAGLGTNRWIIGLDTHNFYVTSGNLINIGGLTYDVSALHDAWFTVLVTWDGTNARLYVNGVLRATNTTGVFSTLRSTGEIWYGDRGGGGFPFRGGQLGMFVAHDASTSFTADVTAIHNAIVAEYTESSGGEVVEFVGSVAGTSSVSATRIDRARAMTASAAAGAGTVSATRINRARSMTTSAIAGTGTCSATRINRARAVSGSSAGAAISSATRINRAASLVTTAAGVSAIAASAMLVARGATGTTAGTSTTSAALSALRRVTATTSGSTTTSGALRRSLAFTATTSGTATTAATFGLRRGYIAAVVGSSAVGGDFEIDEAGGPVAFTGSTSGSSSVAGVLARFRPLDGSATGSGAVNASRLNLARRLTGASEGSGTSAASRFVTARALSGTSVGVGASSGSTFVRTRRLTASTAGTSTSSGALGRRRPFGGTCTSTSSVSATEFVAIVESAFEGATIGTSNVAANLSTSRALTANVTGITTCQASGFVRARGLLASAEGSATCTASLRRACALNASLAGTSSTGTPILALTRSLVSSVVVGASDASASLGVKLAEIRAGIGIRIEEVVKLESVAVESVLITYRVSTGDPKMGLKVGATVTLHIGLRHKGRRYNATTMSVYVRKPSGTILSFALGDLTLVRDGDYTVTFLADEATTRTSTWKYVTQCILVTPSGTVRGSDDGQFDVDALPFTPPP